MENPSHVLVELSQSQDASLSTRILRKIKAFLIGHELRKIQYIRAGIIPTLLQVLQGVNAPNDTAIEDDTAEVDALWHDSAAIISTLAHGGPAFTQPVLAGGLHTLLVSYLAKTNSPRVQVTILRSLITIADNLPPESKQQWSVTSALADILFTNEVAELLARICSYEGQCEVQNKASDVVLELLQKTCRSGFQSAVLINAGLLRTLARKLAVHILEIGNELFGSSLEEDAMIVDDLPVASTYSRRRLPRLMYVVSRLIRDSPTRVKSFLQEPAIVSLTDTFAGWHARRSFRAAPYYTHHISTLTSSSRSQNPFDYLLPEVVDPDIQRIARISGFPLLGATSPAFKRRTMSTRGTSDQTPKILEGQPEHSTQEHVLVAWLVYQIRSSSGSARLAALELVAVLQAHGFVQLSRTRTFASLVIPTLIDVLVETESSLTHSVSTSRAFHVRHDRDEEVSMPTILALLIKDNDVLRRAAVEAHAIPHLAKLLKQNFEQIYNADPNLWWPQPLEEKLTVGPDNTCLGPGGPSTEVRIVMRSRQGILQALAALAPEDDAYRRDICDNGALPNILQSLEPFESHVDAQKHGDVLKIEGNSAETLVAACNAIRALTRSPTALRTKIVDADVSKAIVRLLYTPELTVRVAATMVVANLAHDFSPMKPSIIDVSVTKKLCEQAHSANARLRHESIFALKTMIHNSNFEFKKQIVEQLGPNWIRHLIAIDPHDVPEGEVIGLVEKEYEKDSMVRLVPTTDTSMDDSSHAGVLESNQTSFEYNKHTLHQDLDIQAELLAFLRNLTVGDDALLIIDYLLEEIGQEEFLQILTDRLRHRINPRRGVLTPLTPTATLEHALYILVHLAAADRKYKNILVHNTVLMRQYSQLFQHNEASVRLACLWLTINLIYPTTEPFEIAQQRASELVRHNVKAHVIRLMQTESVMDLKERAAVAVDCFQKLMM